jgi:tRNA pseudouridine55 synthase
LSQLDGLAVIDKPAGCTSHDVVARCRRIFGQKKVGHAGTLDPDATGVLLVGLGQATRLMQFLSGLPKRYTAEVVLGVATSTLDASGEVTGTWDMRAVTEGAAREAAATLTGEINQVPPMVSALKVGGRRLHELARAGVEIERAPRPVTVMRFDVALSEQAPSGYGPVLAIDVECSSGTYVRSLAADLGCALGGGAHLRGLRRMAVGRFTVDRAVSLDELEASPSPASRVLRPPDALGDMRRAVVSGDVLVAVRHGRVLPIEVLLGEGSALRGLSTNGDVDRVSTNGDVDRVSGSALGPWAVLSVDGDLLAVYQAHGRGQAKPAVVLASSSGAGEAGGAT